MGLFDLFKKHTPEEEDLIARTAARLGLGLSAEEARRTATAIVDGCIRECRASGRYDRPRDLGDTLVRFVRGELPPDPDFTRVWRLLSTDGVVEDDLQQWWNLWEVERRVIRQVDLAEFTALVEVQKARGLSEDAAVREVKRHIPCWGDWDNILSPGWLGDNRVLPYEMKGRVNEIIEGAPEVFQAEAEEFATMNAYIRSLARAGRLK